MQEKSAAVSRRKLAEREANPEAGIPKIAAHCSRRTGSLRSYFPCGRQTLVTGVGQECSVSGVSLHASRALVLGLDAGVGGAADSSRCWSQPVPGHTPTLPLFCAVGWSWLTDLSSPMGRMSQGRRLNEMQCMKPVAQASASTGPQ